MGNYCLLIALQPRSDKSPLYKIQQMGAIASLIGYPYSDISISSLLNSLWRTPAALSASILGKLGTQYPRRL